MIPYHKIITVYKRDPDNRYKTLLEGEFALPELEYLKNNDWVFTEKVDGTNIRVMYSDESVVRFGGRTDNAQMPTFLLDKLQDRFTPNSMERVFPDTELAVCLYGEGFGAKIQKVGSKYIPDGVDFCLFDVRIGGNFLARENVEDIADKFQIPIAPIVGRGTLQDAVALTELGFDSTWGDFMAEGMVMRPETELLTRAGKRIISKIKFKDFN